MKKMLIKRIAAAAGLDLCLFLPFWGLVALLTHSVWASLSGCLAVWFLLDLAACAIKMKKLGGAK